MEFTVEQRRAMILANQASLQKCNRCGALYTPTQPIRTCRKCTPAVARTGRYRPQVQYNFVRPKLSA
jgi:ribosomal protein L37AE/L43A